MSDYKVQIIIKSYDKTIIRKEVSEVEGKQLAEQLEKSQNLQSFRNELQEVFFKEHARMMHVPDGTYPVNLINGLLHGLDYDYGTKFQKTESVFKAERKERQRLAAVGNKQLDLLEGAGE